jgi:restriction system protein
MFVGDGQVGKTLANGFRPLAPYLALFFLGLAIFNIVVELRRLRRVEAEAAAQTQEITDLSWERFRLLLTEAFLVRKFQVETVDGHTGVDLVLHAVNGERWFVNCCHWQTPLIDVHAVRELAGVATANNAVACAYVTSGSFAPEATEFAQDKSIHLIGGNELLELLREGQAAVNV